MNNDWDDNRNMWSRACAQKSLDTSEIKGTAPVAHNGTPNVGTETLSNKIKAILSDDTTT